MFETERKCPICYGTNRIYVKIIAGPSKGMLTPIIECHTCRYTNYFESVALLSYLGNAALGFIILIFFLFPMMPNLLLIIYILAWVWILLLPFFWLGIFTKTNLFSKYIDWKILRWASDYVNTERIQQLISKDKILRKKILTRYMFALFFVTVYSIIITSVSIIRITLFHQFTDIYLASLLVSSVVYLMLFMEWKEKLQLMRTNDYYRIHHQYLILGCVMTLEIVISVFIIIFSFM